MKASKLNIICLLTLTFTLILVACKKNNTTQSCTDGFLNNGEESTDCGGPCTPCKLPIFTSIKADFVKSPISEGIYSFDNGAMIHDINWIITASNDSVKMTINLGTSITVDQHYIIDESIVVILKNGFVFVYNKIVPTNPTSYVVITENNTSKKYINGYFRLYFTNTNGSDTLKIEDGVFTGLTYQ